MRVVLVEDEKSMQEALTRIIGAIDGCSVALVTDTAGAAVDWLTDNPSGWDLAIVDVFLRQGHGFDVLRQAAKNKSPNQKTVLLSNYTRKPISVQAARAGADRFFDKSLELEELVAYCKSMKSEVDASRAIRRG